MVHVESRATDNLISGVVVLLLLVALPLVALALLILRGMLLAAGVVAVVFGLLAFAISPSFRAWFRQRSASRVSYKGLQLATDVVFHPSHSWARREHDVVVGADDLAQAALGPVEAVELPDEGRAVRAGDPLFHLKRGDRSLEMRAPLTGTVVGVNPALRSHPELINKDPFNRGWAVRVRSDTPRAAWPQLLDGHRARSWFQADVDRLVGLIAPTSGPTLLADGGPLVGHLHEHIDDDAWLALTDTMFAARPDEAET